VEELKGYRSAECCQNCSFFVPWEFGYTLCMYHPDLIQRPFMCVGTGDVCDNFRLAWVEPVENMVTGWPGDKKEDNCG